MTVFWTIISGVAVYVLGQLVMKFVVEPMHAQRETTGRIIDFLIYHGNRFTSPGPNVPNVDLETHATKLRETRDAGRALASEIMVRTQAIPCYAFWENLGWVRSRKDIREAQRKLLYISSNLFQETASGLDNYAAAESIRNALNVATEFRIEEPVSGKQANGDAQP